ncbi:MAG: hypothetical protein JKX94_09450 [Sneathiella sp.]|nr:hypothetical protein [Sneathiella sp.]
MFVWTEGRANYISNSRDRAFIKAALLSVIDGWDGMMGRFAENTDVSSERSKAEIEKILTRYGATGFMYGWKDDRAMIIFKTSDRQVKFVLPLPDKTSRKFTHTPEKNVQRKPAAMQKAYEQAVRQRWRALARVT